MRLKKNKKETKDETIKFRLSLAHANKIQQKANIYTDGNVSEYVLFAALNFIPDKTDMEKGDK